MAFVGADTGRLRELAKAMSQSSNNLTNEIIIAVSSQLVASPWKGSDRQQFDQRWNKQLVPQLRNVAKALDEAAKTLRKNADDQDKTSDSGGDFTSGGGGLFRGIPDPDERNPRKGDYGLHRDLLDISDACYDHSLGPEHDAKIPRGWEEVSSDELKKLGIDPDKLGTYGDDFSATLYRDINGRYALAFEGTDVKDGRDWLNNAGNSAFLSPQGARSVNLTVEVKRQLQAHGVGKFYLTGHSLGGGLASIASIASGVPAVTFNASGLSRMTVASAEIHRYRTYGAIAKKSEVTAYYASGDVLSVIQDAPKMEVRLPDIPSFFEGKPKSISVFESPDLPEAYGDRKRIDTGRVNIFDIGNGHGHDPLREGIDSLADREGKYYY